MDVWNVEFQVCCLIVQLKYVAKMGGELDVRDVWVVSWIFGMLDCQLKHVVKMRLSWVFGVLNCKFWFDCAVETCCQTEVELDVWNECLDVDCGVDQARTRQPRSMLLGLWCSECARRCLMLVLVALLIPAAPAQHSTHTISVFMLCPFQTDHAQHTILNLVADQCVLHLLIC